MSRTETKRRKTSAATWRKKDREYRERERTRRHANAQRKIDVKAAAELSVPLDVYRKAVADGEI